MDFHPEHNKRITVNLPEKLLKEAQDCTGANMTDTLIEGLKLVKRSKSYDIFMKLRGKLRLDVDVDEARERTR